MSVDSPAAQPITPDSLIEQCLTGDQAAWEQIVRQNWRKVFNVAYKFVGKHEEAEDPDLRQAHGSGLTAQGSHFTRRGLTTSGRRPEFVRRQPTPIGPRFLSLEP